MLKTVTKEVMFDLNLRLVTSLYFGSSSQAKPAISPDISEAAAEMVDALRGLSITGLLAKYQPDDFIYDNVTRITDILRSLSFDDLIAIYNQVEYHQVNKLLIIFGYFIDNLPYKIGLYNWNYTSKVFTSQFIAYRCIDKMYYR